MAQSGAELGLADAVLDLGTAAEPGLHLDHAVEPATVAVLAAGVVGGDMLVTMNDTAPARLAATSRGSCSWFGSMVRRPGAGVGGDVRGFDADPPHDRVGVLGPAGRGVVDRRDLRTGPRQPRFSLQGRHLRHLTVRRGARGRPAKRDHVDTLASSLREDRTPVA